MWKVVRFPRGGAQLVSREHVANVQAWYPKPSSLQVRIAANVVVVVPAVADGSP